MQLNEIWQLVIGAIITTLVGILVYAPVKYCIGIWKNYIRVIRIQDPDKQFERLSMALDIYDDEKRISDDDKDAREDIIRWMEEMQEDKKKGICKLEEYFLVAMTATEMLGMAQVQFYPSSQMAFFSYLVTTLSTETPRNSTSSTIKKISTVDKLFARFRTELLQNQNCKALIAEVEEPNIKDNSKLKDSRDLEKSEVKNRPYLPMARIMTLNANAKKQKMIFREIGIQYRQPGLNCVEPEEQEKPLLLMIILPEQSEHLSEITHDFLNEILTFLEESVYGDSFEYSDQEKEYREYLKGWKERLLKDAPEEIKLYSVKQLKDRYRLNKS